MSIDPRGQPEAGCGSDYGKTTAALSVLGAMVEFYILLLDPLGHSAP